MMRASPPERSAEGRLGQSGVGQIMRARHRDDGRLIEVPIRTHGRSGTQRRLDARSGEEGAADHSGFAVEPQLAAPPVRPRGYWGQEPDTVGSANAVVVLEDEDSARAMAEGISAAIPAATVRVIRVLTEA
jgi:hypothetical protein